jgi:cobalt-zinc-cadmium efflux system membrane fusion protein
LAYAEDEFSPVASPLQGRVVDVRARLGETVKAGQTLIVIDSPDIATAYSDYVKEISELSLAERNYDLAGALFNVQAIPLKEYKQAEHDLNRERAEFAQAKDKLLFLGVAPAELDKPLAQQHITSRFELKSALTGTIVERNVTPGQLVGPASTAPLLVVAELKKLHVLVDVYERDISLMRVGQPTDLVVEAYPRAKFPATVIFIGDVVDPNTRTIKLRALVDNAERRLKPQMYGYVTIQVADLVSMIVVPRRALIQTGGRTIAYVEKAPGHFEPRAVTIEEGDGEQAHVLTGLAEGERIAARPLAAVPPG